MDKLGFFTPVRFDGQEKGIKHHLFEGVEGYFSLGGVKAYVVLNKIVDGSQEVELKYASESKTEKMILGAIKVVSYMTCIIPLMMLVTKAIFRATHKFHVISAAEVLQEGINISDATVSKIRSCMKNILLNKEGDGVHFYKSGDNHRVFSLDAEPELVFKMSSNNVRFSGSSSAIKARYQTMVSAKTVCMTHYLGLLVIPNAKLFKVDGLDIIAEKKVDIISDESAQEKNFEDCANRLNEAIHQLTVFIVKTGFSDVEWRNIPVIENIPDGNCKIALIDIEEMEGAKTGLFGGIFRRGLVGCVNEEQIDIVIEEARKYGLVDEAAVQRVKSYRLEELQSDKQLKQYYKTRNIEKGKEPIQVDVDSLGLDLTEEGQIETPTKIETDDAIEIIMDLKTVTMREVVKDVIKKMNGLIQESSDEKSVKGKRYFVLDTGRGPFHRYNRLGVPPNAVYISEEEEKKIWLKRIIQALIEKGHIFKLDKVNGHGYFVQA